MKTKFLSLLLVFFYFHNSFSQIVTTAPTLPTAGAAVTITFNAVGTGMEGYTGDVYAHTGVTIEGVGRWQHVVESWGNNTTQPKLTKLGTDLYELEISPSINDFYGVTAGEVVTELCIVFRSADANSQTSDIFIEVYEDGLAVTITNPSDQPLFVDAGANFDISAEATLANQITLYIDDVEKTNTTSNILNYTATAEISGSHWIKVVANDDTESVTDSIYYVVRTSSPILALPAGVHDGINYIDNETVTLVLHAPYKNSAYAIGDFNDWVADANFIMNKTSSTASDSDLRFWITINNITPAKEYIFQYLVDEELKIAEPYSDKISDPWNDKYIPDATYPNLIAYPEGKTEGIASVFQTAQTDYSWNIDDFTAPATEDLVIYETLIRDFTADANYQTMIDTIGYLKRLGINAIELMPINEFDGNDSWGYNPAFYFAVDKAYGTKNKLKEFIDVCHANGIAVIIDMVLNHSYGQSPLVQLYFDANAGDYGQPSAQNPWYNETSPNTTYSWGYDFDHESSYTKAFVDSVNSYWLTEYKVDGFRFDFTKGFTNTTGDGWAYDAARIAILKRMYNEIIAINPEAYVIFEHLADNSEEKELSAHGIMLWGNMSGKYTNAAIGNVDSDYSDLSYGSYQNRGWTDPNLVSYMESHDEQRLMYSAKVAGHSDGSYDIKDLNTSLKRMEMDACFFLTIPGPKMIWQFGELGYDISIDENGRTGKKPVLWNYFDVADRYRLYQIYQALIGLKNEYNVFRTTDYSMNVSAQIKTMNLNDAEMNVTIVGNFDVKARRVDPNFQQSGTWYDYFSGEEITVNNVNSEIILEPGEYHIYTDKKLSTPDIVADVEKISEESGNLIQLNVYPNPAISYNTISVLADQQLEDVSVKIYDLKGTLINNLYSGKLNKGQNDFSWDLKNVNGKKVSSGIYFSTIQTKNFSKNIMMIID